MKRYILIVLLFAPLAFAQTPCPGTLTPKRGLCVPNHGVPNWDQWINGNWTIIDNITSGGGGNPASPAFYLQGSNITSTAFSSDSSTNPFISSQLTASVNSVINVKAPPYNAKGDGVTDDTAAIQAVLDAMKAGLAKRAFFPAGTYLVGANGVGLVNAPYLSYVLEGAGIYSTTIEGSGSVVLDLGGTDNVNIRHMAIQGNNAAIGLQLCRYASPGSNGPGSGHKFYDLLVTGTFTTAAVYSIASELVSWDRSWIRSTSNVPLLYTSATNDLNVTPFRGTILASTNTGLKIDHSFFYSYGTGAGAEAITFGSPVAGNGAPATAVVNSYFACARNCIRFTGTTGDYNLGPYEIRGNFFEATASTFTAVYVDPVRLSGLTLEGNYVSNDSGGTNPDFYEANSGGLGDIESARISNNAWTTNYPNVYYFLRSDVSEGTQYTVRGNIINSRIRVPTLLGSPSISTSEVMEDGAMTLDSLTLSGAAILPATYYLKTGGNLSGPLGFTVSGTPASSIGSASSNNLYMLGGAKYVGSYVALDTIAEGIDLYNGGMYFFGDTGLTIGNVYTPTAHGLITQAGNWDFQKTIQIASDMGVSGFGYTIQGASATPGVNYTLTVPSMTGTFSVLPPASGTPYTGSCASTTTLTVVNGIITGCS